MPTIRPGTFDAGLSLTIFVMIGYLLKTKHMSRQRVAFTFQQVRCVKTTKIDTRGDASVVQAVGKWSETYSSVPSIEFPTVNL